MKSFLHLQTKKVSSAGRVQNCPNHGCDPPRKRRILGSQAPRYTKERFSKSVFQFVPTLRRALRARLVGSSESSLGLPKRPQVPTKRPLAHRFAWQCLADLVLITCRYLQGVLRCLRERATPTRTKIDCRSSCGCWCCLRSDSSCCLVA